MTLKYRIRAGNPWWEVQERTKRGGMIVWIHLTGHPHLESAALSLLERVGREEFGCEGHVDHGSTVHPSEMDIKSLLDSVKEAKSTVLKVLAELKMASIRGNVEDLPQRATPPKEESNSAASSPAL